MAETPISRWIEQKAWFLLQGPPGGLGDDFRAAMTALEAAKPYIPEKQQRWVYFLPPWRNPYDYVPWGVDLSEFEGLLGPTEFYID